MRWRNRSTDKQYRHEFGDYVIQKQRPGIVWRLFTRDHENEPLRVIYVAETKKACQEYAKKYDAERTAGD